MVRIVQWWYEQSRTVRIRIVQGTNSPWTYTRFHSSQWRKIELNTHLCGKTVEYLPTCDTALMKTAAFFNGVLSWLPPPKEVMFLVLSVCLSLSIRQITEKLWTDFDKISWRDRDQWVQFWWRSGSLSASRNPKFEIWIYWIIEEVTNGFWWNFMESWGCGLETNCLHLGDDPHHYPDPGVHSGSRSGFGKNCHNSIMLAFGGGLCFLSTSSVFTDLVSLQLSSWQLPPVSQ